MIEFKMDFKPFQKAIQELQKRKNIAIEKSLAKVVLEIKRDQIAKKDVPRAMGGLINSWKVENPEFNHLIAGFTAPYSQYQHEGQREDGSHKIRNRPAGGRTYWFKETIDQNKDKYYKIFADTLKKELDL